MDILLLLYIVRESMQRVTIMPLGAGCEVGRSCLIVTINEKRMMLDCGLMINKEEEDSLPLFDGNEDVAVVLITHAHLDHCGALPYFLAHSSYKGKVYMTKPTKDIYHYLVRDTVKVQKDRALFDNQAILDSLDRIIAVDFGVQFEVAGIRVTPYVAGHIVGAAMFVIECDGVSILYTGDYSCEEDRYIMKAEIPQGAVDILIAESTFGTRVHENRQIREQKLKEVVKRIVVNGGKCLLPVFSAGRAEQLLFILDEFWKEQQAELGHVGVYYTVSLIDKCKHVYETYIDMLSAEVRQRFYKEEANPFNYRFIRYIKEHRDNFAQEANPMVVMCTPGMLQNGQSRALLEKWCHDKRNGVVITGYCAEGSMASNLKTLRRGDTILAMNKTESLPVNLQVEEISFAAHADCLQTTEFVARLQPAHVVLVHGSARNAQSLRLELQEKFPSLKSVSCPKNRELLPFEIAITEQYQVAGSLLAKLTSPQGPPLQHFRGYIVNTHDQKVLIEEKDRSRLFPQLQGLTLRQRIFVNYVGSLTLAHLLAQRIFNDAETIIQNGEEVLVVRHCINLTLVEPGHRAQLDFISSPQHDIIADQFCFLLANILYDPLLKDGMRSTEETVKHTLLFKLILVDYPQSTAVENIIVVKRKGQALATVNTRTLAVDATDQYMRMRLIGLLDQSIPQQ